MPGLSFSKMHGAGNDFVVLDRRAAQGELARDEVVRIAERRTGVGCDQLLTLERATREDCVARYRIWNRDGSAALQCGNGVRCLVAWLKRDGVVDDRVVKLEGPAGVVSARIAEDGSVSVEMGVPRFEPADIPFDAARDAPVHALDADGRAVEVGVVSIGNPHAVLVVSDTHTAPVATLGPAIESHPRFPERANVGFAQVLTREAIRLRVYERGAGETLACGSGACAAVAVLRRRGTLDARVAVTLPGGTLVIEWPGEGQPLWMSGPAAFVFEGEWIQ
ncbi:MAG TPA: diaminopimelate epimerase [Candidatus Saccharimonadia bacterium]|nr:diaminopimelate epimerase [Candidatus Saccharimonadia bacterium]